MLESIPYYKEFSNLLIHTNLHSIQSLTTPFRVHHKALFIPFPFQQGTINQDQHTPLKPNSRTFDTPKTYKEKVAHVTTCTVHRDSSKTGLKLTKTKVF